MENLFSLKYGISGICVLLTLMILTKVAEFVWKLREKKESASEAAINELTKAVQANTIALQFLERRFGSLEAAMAEFPKLKNDLRRFYCALKDIAGDRWPAIREDLMKDGFNS